MEKLLALVAAGLMLVSFATLGLAQGYNTMGTPQGEPWPAKTDTAPSALMTYSGHVDLFDRVASRLAVSGANGVKTFNVARATINGLISRDKDVTVQYRATHNGLIASSVTAVPRRTVQAQPPPQRVTEVQPVPPVPESVFFAYDKSDITPQMSVALKNQAEWLKQNPDRKLEISGNTDERGTEGYNQRLGQERADVVKNHLVQLGVSPDRMTTTSNGKNNPVCSESTASCQAANRRVDLNGIG